VVKIQIVIFWIVTPCSIVVGYKIAADVKDDLMIYTLCIVPICCSINLLFSDKNSNSASCKVEVILVQVLKKVHGPNKGRE